MHAFLSSNTLDNAYYPTLAGILMRTACDMAEKTGLDIAFINLSGGIGIPYQPTQTEPDVLQIGEQVRKVYTSIFGDHGPALKTELGRWMTGPEGWLITHATHHKDTYRHYIGLDACAVNLMRPAMYGAYHHITVVDKEDQPHDHIYDVT
ncbi:MAG: diaminopimelate decarboxylase, partial [Oscillospiraceae bacterium]|nr:diaminopimelate decarboxylase [Oscillospiraceae bacterium]